MHRGLVEQETLDEAYRLFSSKEARRYEGSMFTNGDFYPRNFIFLPHGKIAVVDWVGGIDPWEFVAMHAWLLMWGNPAWQLRYTTEIKADRVVLLSGSGRGASAGSMDRGGHPSGPEEAPVEPITEDDIPF